MRLGVAFALMVTTLPRLLRTLWHVPPGQLWARLAYRARCRFYYGTPLYGVGEVFKEPAEAPEEPLGAVPRLRGGDAARGVKIAAGEWPLAGVTLPRRERAKGAMEWFPARATALWVFNLHYFEWLDDLWAADDRDTAQSLLRDWLEQNNHWHPVAWHPYPLSLRIVSWLQHGGWLMEDAEADLRAAFADSLRRQVAHLSENIEHDLGGNHVLKNLRALITAALALPGEQGRLAPALAAWLREISKQVHADGGHYEASPMYQAQVLEDVLSVNLLLKKHGGVPPALADAAKRMGAALALYRHLDGALALFNDSAEGDPAWLDRLVTLAGVGDVEPPVSLPNTGYARLERGTTLVLADAGRVGPDENPGHAHADMLSFEMSVGRQRMIVNSGTYAYQDRLRNVLRGTAAHSTVLLDGEDSAEVWAAFRVGRRPRNVGFELKDVPEGDMTLAGWHDGYIHRGVMHRREWLLAADGSRLRGRDALQAVPLAWWRKLLRPVLRRGPVKRALAHFVVHPAVGVRLVNEQEAHLTLPDKSKWVFQLKGTGRLDVRPARYAPQFGTLLETKALVVHLPLRQGGGVLDWELRSGQAK